MLGKRTFWLAALVILLAGFLAAPATGLAKEKGMAGHMKAKDKMVQELKLTPEQAKKFKDLEEKFTQERLQLYSELNKVEGDLQKVLAQPKPDEAKIKELVGSYTKLKDKLWTNYQDWWHGEMEVLNPEQQARYLLAMSKWWKKMMGERAKGKMGMEGHRGMKMTAPPAAEPEKK